MSIPGSANPLLLASAAGTTGYNVQRSLRFNSADSAYLSRTPSSAGNRKTWTWSGWVKRSGFTKGWLLVANYSNSPWFVFGYDNDQIYASYTAGVSGAGQSYTSAVFRDPSAWYHVVLAFDSTQSTAGDRLKIYVNGVQQTLAVSNPPALNTDYQVNNNVSHLIGGYTGEYFSGYLAECYLIDGQQLTPSSFTEVSATTGQLVPKQYSGSYGTNGFKLDFADNSAATAAALGKDTSGNGNNWTPFSFAVSASPVYSLYTTASPGFSGSYPVTRMFDGNTATEAITSNSSGVGSITFTPNTAIAYSSGVEVYNATGVAITATLNGGSPVTLSTTTGWNTVASGSGSITSLVLSRSNGAVAVSAIRINGTTILTDGAGAGNDSLVDTPTSYGTDTGAGGEVRGNYCTLNPLHSQGATFSNGNLQFVTSSIGKIFGTVAVGSGKWYWESVNLSSNSLSSLVNGIGLITGNPNNWGGSDPGDYAWLTRSNAPSPSSAYNNGSVTGYGNIAVAQNAVVGTAFDADNGTLEFFVDGVSKGVAWSNIPVGGGRLYAPISGDPNSSTDTEGLVNFGQRPWAYTPPAGFKALVDTNLPTPVVAKPSTVFDTTLYTGNGSTQTITGLGFSPDWVWVKARNAAQAHRAYDSVRGVEKTIYPGNVAAEYTGTAEAQITAFTSDGFTADVKSSDGSGLNKSSETYVAWCWDAGSSNATNTQGSITSSVRANTSSGFSVISWTGNGTNGATVGHGLGVTPGFVLIKNRDNTSNMNWVAWHGSISQAVHNSATIQLTSITNALFLNLTLGQYSYTFDNQVNGSGEKMIAYAWAPVAGYSSFGSYVGTANADGPMVWLGFRPRWILFKNTSVGVEDWWLHDTARNTYNVMTSLLVPNSANAEGTNAAHSVDALSNGFKIRTTAQGVNGSGHTIVWAAFAESPFQYARAR